MKMYAEPAHLPPRIKRTAAAVLAMALLLTLLCPLRAAAEDKKSLKQAIREAENNGGEELSVRQKKNNGIDLLLFNLERRGEKKRVGNGSSQEQKESNNARIRYVDPLTGTSFSAPTGWIRYGENEGEEESVVFYEYDPLSMLIGAFNLLYYQSLDLWEGMTEEQKQALPREKLDTTLLSRNIVAKLLNVSQLRLKRWTCNGRVYYLYSGEQTDEILGKIQPAFAVCIVNGCLYRYMVAVSPRRTDDSVDILKDVLTTAEYPTPAPEPARGGGLAEWGIGFGIAALILIVGTGLKKWYERNRQKLSIEKALKRAGLKLRKPAFRNSHTANLLLMLLGLAGLMAVEIWLERQGQGTKSRILVFAAALMMVRELTAFVAEGRALRKQREEQKRVDPAPSAQEEPTEGPTQKTESAEKAAAEERQTEEQENP